MVKIIKLDSEGAQVWSKRGSNYYALRKRLRPNEGENRYRCGANECMIIMPYKTAEENWQNKKIVHNVYIVRYGKDRKEDGLFHKKLKQREDKFIIQK